MTRHLSSKFLVLNFLRRIVNIMDKKNHELQKYKYFNTRMRITMEFWILFL